MKIYDYEGFPNPARIRIALAEKGITDQVEFISIDVPKGEHRKPEFLAKNPSGTVPVLELDNGTTLSECTAITEYLDRTYNGCSLTGTTPKQRAAIQMMQRRAAIQMMQRRAAQNLLDAVAGYFHHATDGLGPEIETYQNKNWGNKQRKRALQGMRYFDTVLADNSYVAGDTFSMADITAFAGLAFADFIKLEIPGDLQHLSAWRDRVARCESIAG